jgi:hypothetical protein
MAKEVDAKQLEDKVAVAVAKESASVPDTESDESDEKLDARAAMFVRQVTDSVVKQIADLIKPPEPEPEPEPEPKARRRKQAPSILDLLLRPLI